MQRNTVSVTAYLVDGGINQILEEANPKDAIEQYLLPDMRPPVQTLVIEAQTDDGKTVVLSISNRNVHASLK